MSKVASQYLRKVEKRIDCSTSLKTEFLCQLEDEVFLYCEDHGDVDENALIDKFGSPQEIAHNFLNELGPDAIGKSFVVKRRALIAVVCIVLVALILVAIIGMCVYIMREHFTDPHYVDSITYEEIIISDSTAPTYWADEFDVNDNN